MGRGSLGVSILGIDRFPGQCRMQSCVVSIPPVSLWDIQWMKLTEWLGSKLLHLWRQKKAAQTKLLKGCILNRALLAQHQTLLCVMCPSVSFESPSGGGSDACWPCHQKQYAGLLGECQASLPKIYGRLRHGEQAAHVPRLIEPIKSVRHDSNTWLRSFKIWYCYLVSCVPPTTPSCHEKLWVWWWNSSPSILLPRRFASKGEWRSTSWRKEYWDWIQEKFPSVKPLSRERNTKVSKVHF